MSTWDTIESKLHNPYVAGATVATLGALAFFGVRAAMGDGWPKEGDSCPVEIYMDRVGSKVGKRAWQYMPLLRHAADSFNVDPTLLAGIVHTESAFSPIAGSSAGALGLTQVIKSTAISRYEKLVEQGNWPFGGLRTTGDNGEAYFAEHGAPMAIDRTDPKQSLWLGASTIASLLRAGKGVEWALAAYNGGPGVANKPVDQRPVETQKYVPGVLKRQRWYQQIAERCGGGALA